MIVKVFYLNMWCPFTTSHGEVTPSLINAYMCAHDLFIGGLFALQKRLQGMVFFKIKVNACILIHPIIQYTFLGESFKNNLFYLYCIIFLIPQEINFLLGAQLLSIFFFLNRILFRFFFLKFFFSVL